MVNLLTFTAIAIFSSSFIANALSVDSSAHIARHQVIARSSRQFSEPIVIKKRSSGRCRARPSSLSVSSAPRTTIAPAPAPTSTKAPPAPSPSSSSAPAPSSPPPKQGSGGRGKTGIAWALGDDKSLKNFLSQKVGSIYTWSPFKPVDASGLEFIPMLWGLSQIDDFKRLVVPGYANAVLGFNEPDLDTQSHIDPGTAASIWQQHIQPLKSQGYALISPAPTSAPTGINWLKDFMGACKGCSFDAIALHWYGTDAQQFISYVTNFHNTFGRDIWVTEFACQNFAGGPQANQDQIFAFMETVTKWMDSTPMVAKYFAFGVMRDMGNVNPLNRLMNDNGTPTQLGLLYIN